MLIIFLLIGLGLLISGLYVHFSYDDDSPYGYIGSIFGGLLSLVSFIVLLVGGVTISKGRVIDQKITMYEEENARIEYNITESVEKYLEHEYNIYDSLQGDNIEVLLVAYPQIKSDTLVEKQLEIFISNNDKIKQLKEERLNIQVWRFWVYFG